jgi:RimJ/RimL family protein N-acetyltransferase
MIHLLHRLEDDMFGDFGIRDLYTLARADEVGMNRALARLGYAYTGRLVNDCRMPNGWESLNVWCKCLGEQDGREAGAEA